MLKGDTWACQWQLSFQDFDQALTLGGEGNGVDIFTGFRGALLSLCYILADDYTSEDVGSPIV